MSRILVTIASLVTTSIAAFTLTSQTTGPTIAILPSHSSQAFLNSIGINIHLGYTDTRYENLSGLELDLRKLGVSHVRDGLRSTDPNDWVYAHAQALRSEGVDFDWILGDPEGRWMSGSMAQIVATLTGPLAGTSKTLEGPNEYDCDSGDPLWSADLRGYQETLAKAVRRNTTLAKLPLLGPSLCGYGDREVFGDDSAEQDAGNIHPYPGGSPPESNIATEIQEERVVCGAQPQYATETGYHLHSASDSEYNYGVSEAIEAVYIPRLYLDYFMHGVTRTFDYELYDLPAAADGEPADQQYGLISSDGTRRPAYTALQRLIADIGHSKQGTAERTGLAISVRSESMVDKVLFERSDGSYDLAIWRPISPDSSGNFTSRAVEVVLPKLFTITETRPSISASARTLIAVNSLKVSLGGDVMLLHLQRFSPRVGR